MQLPLTILSALSVFLLYDGATASPTAIDKDNTMQSRQSTRTLGFIGCSMAENVAQGYVAVGGQRLWGPYGTGGMVVQSWTNNNSNSWRLFDQHAARYGKPNAVWVQVCIFSQQGVTYDEVKRLISNAREHASPGADIYITGQPVYEGGNTCFLADSSGQELTESLAKRAAEDPELNVKYAGQFVLKRGEVSDGCHANTAGQQSLGRQALAYWG
ncbi:hypothetical protein B0T21DRAFT_407636 [Apiosordaria backusii]|uniref:Sialate O-acetylesterase domain-containing protein n=1 Tax=Apiosordaria backusii TaxID=314023 RepID=A0AA40ES86_9PEZI|nr:hypothetical protein B0T21DRAFT_407636 [Apiosordaria backusii]